MGGMDQLKCGADDAPTRPCTVATTQQGTPSGNELHAALPAAASGARLMPGSAGAVKPDPPAPGSVSVPVPVVASGALAGLATTVTRVPPSGCVSGS